MIDLIVQAAATYRLTRLVTTDRLTDEWRVRLQAALKAQGRDKAAYLLECEWCMSFWSAAVVLALHRSRGGRALNRALALSAFTGIVAERL